MEVLKTNTSKLQQASLKMYGSDMHIMLMVLDQGRLEHVPTLIYEKDVRTMIEEATIPNQDGSVTAQYNRFDLHAVYTAVTSGG
jgi:hypothetical protein